MARFVPGNRRFQKRCLELQAFKNIHGHCNVCSGNGGLGEWVKWQRRLFREGRLRPNRLEMLVGLGLDFRPNRSRLMHRVSELRCFIEKHGDPYVSGGRELMSAGLYSWIGKQGRSFLHGRLKEERRLLLQSVGFDISLHPLTSKEIRIVAFDPAIQAQPSVQQ